MKVLFLCLLFLSSSIAAQTEHACATPAISAPAFACRNGSATATVTSVYGARYEWIVEGAAIVGAADTNRVLLQITNESSVKLQCVITSDECGTKNAAATIQVREPLRVRLFNVPAATNANEPLTITWSYEPGSEPQSQMLAGDLFPEPVSLIGTQRTYTFTPKTGGSRTIELRASYAQAVATPPSAKKRRRAIGTAPSSTDCPSAVATARVEVRGCASAEPQLDAPFDAGAGATFTVKVAIADGEKVEWSAENGSVQSVSPWLDEATFVAGTSGQTKVTARVQHKNGCVSIGSSDVAIILPANQCAVPPTATLSYVSHDCDQAQMRVTFTGNGPFAGEWSDGTPFRTSSTTGHYFSRPGTLTINNFRDASCFGTVTGAKTLEQFKPTATLDATNECDGTHLVATFTGAPPFAGYWSDGRPFQTAEMTLARTVQGDVESWRNEWSIYVTDSACNRSTKSRIVDVPHAPAFELSNLYCQSSPNYGARVGGNFRGGPGPYRIVWADGVESVSMNPDSAYRTFPPIATTSAQVEIARAYVGNCEVTPANRFATIVYRPTPVITSSATSTCVTQPLTASLTNAPPPDATIEWLSANNLRILSGQGTPTITFTADAAAKYDLSVKVSYPDVYCWGWSQKASYVFMQGSTATNIHVVPETIPPKGTAIITWQRIGNPTVTVSTIASRAADLEINPTCCSATFVDTVGTAANVPFYVSWNDPCLGPQTYTLNLTITP